MSSLRVDCPARLLRDSALPGSSPDLLRQRLDEDGYLYLPKYAPAESLSTLLREFMEVARHSGWLLPDMAGERLTSIQPHFELFELDRLHRFPREPLFTELFAEIFAEDPLLHPQIVARLRFPNCDVLTTPPHQDLYKVRGSADTLTVWIPLTDCTAEMGGLQLLPGSHRRGLLPMQVDPETGRDVISCTLPDDWAGGDYRLGDVVIFHGLTVHRGTHNRSCQVRVSIDFRCQRLSDPVQPPSFKSTLVCLTARATSTVETGATAAATSA